jgi:hypothetical protein
MGLGCGGSVCVCGKKATGRKSGVQPTHLGTNRVPKMKKGSAISG